jgi:vacuolar protein sorting-associated protein 13A/C
MDSGYPNMTICIRSPLELENLLPYDIAFTVIDKDAKQHYAGTLESGKSSPVHSVNLGHLIGLRLEVNRLGMWFWFVW